MDNAVSKIKELTVSRRYEEAFQLGRMALAENSTNSEVLDALYVLTAKLRSECIYLACKKMDCGLDYQLLETVLRKTNALTGEDMYGRFV
ncbi:hypothetical protein [Collimonas arenae]|uniref:hypothetical protein n=1 Tax=Collimonas arenae TaxID=279058 RepID=UPI00056DA327|nr:hypothetical protein [Collimonas arenae]